MIKKKNLARLAVAIVFTASCTTTFLSPIQDQSELNVAYAESAYTVPELTMKNKSNS